MVTGKNKEQFQEWCCSLGGYVLYNKKYLALVDSDDCFIVYFYNLPFEMQLGVYLAYYDSKGVDVGVIKINNKYFSLCAFYFNGELVSQDLGYKETKTEAYKEGLKQANKLMNSN